MFPKLRLARGSQLKRDSLGRVLSSERRMSFTQGLSRPSPTGEFVARVWLSSAVVLALAFLCAGRATAQSHSVLRRPAPFVTWHMSEDSQQAPLVWVEDYPKTHWLEGAIAGGALLGLGGAALAGGFCSYSETSDGCTGSTIGGFVVGAGTGFALGALIGGRFPKHERKPDSTSIRAP